MNTEEKARAYDKALEQAKKELAVSSPDSDSTRQIFRFFPQLKRKWIFNLVNNMSFENLTASECAKNEEWKKKVLAYLEKQKAMTAEEHEIVKVNINGIHGLFPPVGDGQYIDETDGTLQVLEKQKEQKPIRDIISGDAIESCMLRYLQSAANRNDDIEIIEDTKKYKKELLEIIEKEQKPELVQQPPITYTYPSDASRDERLKAALLALLNSDLLKVKEGGYFTKQDLIEWVERTPTDKPAEWSEGKIPKDIEKDAVQFCFDKGLNVTPYQAKQIASHYLQIGHNEIYQAAKHDLAIKFMNYLDENRPEGKMGLSNGECEDIDKAFKENDWAKIERYIHKYHWKPSEEQMAALDKAIPVCMGVVGRDEIMPLESLYEQLKKL